MLNVKKIVLKPKKVTKKITPEAPIIYGMPISYILTVVGHSSLIRYPKIQDIAEMIMRIIPVIPVSTNPFFAFIFYSLSIPTNILIPIRFSSRKLYKLKESFFPFVFEQNYHFLRLLLIET